MSATEFRPGDIAMVTSELDDVSNEPGVFLHLDGTRFWSLTSGQAVMAGDAGVGPVLGNVGDIAAMMTKAHEAVEEIFDFSDPYTIAYVKGRNARLDEIADLQAKARQAKAEGRREALAEVFGKLDPIRALVERSRAVYTDDFRAGFKHAMRTIDDPARLPPEREVTP